MNTFHRQKGMTAISLVALLILLGFVALVALKVLPIYLDHFKVKSHLNTLAEDAATDTLSADEISRTYFKRLDIDDVENVKPENFFVEKSDSGATLLVVEYEVRRHIFANIDVVVNFVEEAEVKG